MARGRPRTSPEAKAAKKASAQAAKAQSIAADALTRIPELAGPIIELFDELRALKSATQSAAGEVGAQKKRMSEVFGIDPKTTAIIQGIQALPSGRREAVIRQVKCLIDKLGLDAQLDLFNDGVAVRAAPDEGSVFDKTGAGEHVSAERGDDPGRARKSVGGPPRAPVIPTPNVGVEGLAAGIKPLEEPEAKRARIEAEKQADAAAFDKPGAAKADEIDAEMKNMTPAQKRAHAKKIAEEVFAKQGNVGLGADGIH